MPEHRRGDPVAHVQVRGEHAEHVGEERDDHRHAAVAAGADEPDERGEVRRCVLEKP